jgi:hypothetical protein
MRLHRRTGEERDAQDDASNNPLSHSHAPKIRQFVNSSI